MKLFLLAMVAATVVLSVAAANQPSSRLANNPCDHPCAADPAWFPTTPRPTFSKPDPDQDCDFYRPAWQMLLYSMQEEKLGDGPRLFSYDHPNELFSQASVSRFPSPTVGMIELAPRVALQNGPLTDAEINQAGSNGILVDPFTGRVVYYSVHLNDVFSKFIRQNGYDQVLNLKNAPASQEFPLGATEFKTSWRILPDKDPGDGFITTKAVVSKLTHKGSKIVIDPTATEIRMVALLGIHVVFVLDGHPEFIWATFEHKSNAPELNTSRVLTPPGAALGSNPVDSKANWTLYRQGTAADLCNKRNPAAQKLDETTQVVTPATDVFRQFHFGNDDDPCTIETLNQSVHEGIDKSLAGAPGSDANRRLAALKNYDLKGAMWLNNPAYFREGVDFAALDEKEPTKGILGGDTQLSNSTIETFTQSWTAMDTTGNRQSRFCFDCHRTTDQGTAGIIFPAKRLGVSQTLVQKYVQAAAAPAPTK